MRKTQTFHTALVATQHDALHLLGFYVSFQGKGNAHFTVHSCIRHEVCLGADVGHF